MSARGCTQKPLLYFFLVFQITVYSTSLCEWETHACSVNLISAEQVFLIQDLHHCRKWFSMSNDQGHLGLGTYIFWQLKQCNVAQYSNSTKFNWRHGRGPVSHTWTQSRIMSANRERTSGGMVSLIEGSTISASKLKSWRREEAQLTRNCSCFFLGLYW